MVVVFGLGPAPWIFGGLMNTCAKAGNRMGVIRAALHATALLLLAPLAGCAGPARSPGPPGSTLILLENRVEAPCDLTWANTRIDDHPLDLSTIAPPGARPAPLARPILAPGPHTISIAASASCTTNKGEQPAVLQVTQQVYMGKSGGQILVAIARDSGAAAGIKATFDVQGGHVSEPRADGQDVDCRSRLPMDRAICRTEASLARAHAGRDVVLALCLSDKLKEMQLVKGTLEPAGVSTGAAQDPAVRDVAESAEQRVVALAIEADYCIGNETMTDSGMQVEKRSPKTTAPAFR